MDLSIIGKFIKDERKSKGLTQIELANKLMVSEKTISKWECGNGFPDTTLILPLCKELNITANELLSGKKLGENEYKTTADDNLISMRKEVENKDKLLLNLEYVIGFGASIYFFVLIFVASFVEMADLLRIGLIIFGVIEFIVGMNFAILIEKDAGFYECGNCHHKYIPTYKSVYFSMHLNRTRYMKCPKCGKRSWNKKVITK